MFDNAQIIISALGVAGMALIAFGTQKKWEGRIEEWKRTTEIYYKQQYESIRQLCVKHQEHIECLDRSDATQTQELKEHERRIIDLEIKS